jgi:SAM-dependent methyltransferase
MTPQNATASTGPDVSPPYGRFAAAYAAGAEREFSQTMARFALQQAESIGPPCRSVVDVACGIGAACEFFAAGGLQVAGTDASYAMVERARAAAAARGLDITYAEQDMRHLAVAERADLVTCMYDSLNFMTRPTDLRSAFESARNALRLGGRYVFDLYTITGLAQVWGSEDAIHTVHPDHFVASRTAWDPATSMNTKTLWGFDRAGPSWEHWEERHTMRAYPLDDLTALLHSAGFEVTALHGWTGTTTSPITVQTARAVVVATAA